jgi:ribonuclease P/MRP protein subunit RPP1
MYFDLNVPVPTRAQLLGQSQSKKGKGKQPQQSNVVVYTAAQIAVIEARVDLLLHCEWLSRAYKYLLSLKWTVGYTVLAFNQYVAKRVDAKSHVNVLDPLLAQLRKRHGVVFLKRLTLILDQESEKGTGLVRFYLT